MTRAVEFENEGQLIRGMLHVPRTRRKTVPAVLLCHGFTGQRIEAHCLFVKTSRALAEAGIASLRFDFRGSGESDGAFETMTVSGEVSDALAAAAWLARRRIVDRERMGILGLSLGGMVTALVLGRTARFRSAALWSAVARPTWLRERMPPGFLRSCRRRGYLDLGGSYVGAPFFGDLPNHDPVGGIASSPADVLVVHGREDGSVPLEQAREYVGALKRRKNGARTQTAFIKGADHTFGRRDWERSVIRRTVAWFEGTL